jgi:hypothetical protein
LRVLLTCVLYIFDGSKRTGHVSGGPTWIRTRDQAVMSRQL